MDFCAGIGGGRIGLSDIGMKCVGHSEIDPKPDLTYNLFFPESKNYGDLMTLEANDLPYFDLMVAGFPCQTFSIVGKREGFSDTRGMVIYGLIKILVEKDIKYFILENVKGLTNHDRGRTFKQILAELDRAGYNTYHKILNSINFGIPQMRERIYLVGFRKDLDNYNFKWPENRPNENIKDYLVDDASEVFDCNNKTFQKYLNNKYNKNKYRLEDILVENFLVLDWRQSDLRIYKDRCPTLRTGRHGLLYTEGGVLKKVSGYESLLLQGFPKKLADKIKKSDISETTILSQAGNAMTVNVIREIGKSLIKSIETEKGIWEEQQCMMI